MRRFMCGVHIRRPFLGGGAGVVGYFRNLTRRTYKKSWGRGDIKNMWLYMRKVCLTSGGGGQNFLRRVNIPSYPLK